MLGWLAGIGSLAILGVGPFIAAGHIMGALSGASIGAASGSLSGALTGLGMPDYEAKRYEGKIIGGSTLISIHTTNSETIDQVKEIFDQADAEDISSAEESPVNAA